MAALASCKSSPGNQRAETEESSPLQADDQFKGPDPGAGTLVFQAEDQEILERILDIHKEDTDLAISGLMVEVGRFFLGTPYVAHTLEKEGDEQLIINLRELDCTTFAENCLAISRTIKSGKHSLEQFASELLAVR